MGREIEEREREEEEEVRENVLLHLASLVLLHSERDGPLISEKSGL